MSYLLVTRELRAEKVSDRVRRFRFTDGSVDRHGSIFDPDGWDFSPFERGGSINWNHHSTAPDMTPIAKPVDMHRGLADGVDGWDISVEFAPAEAEPMAERVMQGVDFGSIRMTSIGAIPHERATLSSEERTALGLPDHGIKYTRQELLEVSIVGVGSNRNALKRSIEGALKSGSIAPDVARMLVENLEADQSIGLPAETISLAESMERVIRSIETNTRAVEALVRDLSRAGGSFGAQGRADTDDDPDAHKGYDPGAAIRALLADATDGVRKAAGSLRGDRG